MGISSAAALWYLPFVLPICLYVAFTDLRDMKITNQAVVALAGLFLILGLITLPLPDYAMRLAQMVGVLIIGILLNAAGVMGAGDAKFIAAAAPYITPSDGMLLLTIYLGTLLVAVTVHKIAKHSPLRELAPHWQSWDRGRKFPMGFVLGPAFAIYLIMGVFLGA